MGSLVSYFIYEAQASQFWSCFSLRKMSQSYTIQITYSSSTTTTNAASKNKPMKCQGQVQPMINLPTTPSEKPTKTKSILKPAQFQDHDFSKHNRRVRLFLESEQTLL